MSKESGRPAEIEASGREKVQEALLSWFGSNARDLPWRRTRDPWRILVSEVMLQQIQVQRAVPFYERFLARFPTVEALAEAPLAEAIRVWEDLGRYRRIVYLHKTARIVMEEHKGKIPSDPEELIKLPGIGPYTAGAVACFAYERDAVFLDTTQLVPPRRGWLWNQALIETGALICTARSPRCEECPLREGCRARDEATAAGWPKPERKPAVYRYEDTNRYYRGRVLAELREVSHDGKDGIALRELGRRVKSDFDERNPYWLHAAVESLCKDGLAKVELGSEVARVPEVVAEGPAAYGVASEELQNPSLDQRVSLPDDRWKVGSTEGTAVASRGARG